MSPGLGSGAAATHPRKARVVFDIAWRPALRAAPPARPAPDDGARSAPTFSASEQVALSHVVEEVRRCFQADGGDLALVGTSGNTVHVTLSGTCAECGLASVSLGGLQQRLIQALGRPVRVCAVEGEPGASSWQD